MHHTISRGTGNRAYILARLERDGHAELAAVELPDRMRFKGIGAARRRAREEPLSAAAISMVADDVRIDVNQNC